MKCYLKCIKATLLLAFALLWGLAARAQTLLNPNTVSAPLSPGQYYHPTQIELNPGFSFEATSTNNLLLYISNCIPLGTAPSDTLNYILTTVPRIPGFNPSLTTNSICDAMQTVAYFDGLGRPLQTVQVRGNADAGKDVIQPFEYDAFGRELKKYLPYTKSTTTPGAYRPNALSTEQAAFYGTAGQGYKDMATPFSITVVEPSPLNRPLEQGAPGNAWQPLNGSISGSGHTVKTVYTANNTTALTDTANSRWVALYAAAINTDGSRTLSRTGNYAANELYVTIVKDENWTSGRAGTVEEYKDKDGQVVLKRNFNWKNNALEILSTYYVYDDLGQLAFVLPPGANADNLSLSSASYQTTLDNLCYQYRYGDRNRLTQKKLPGKGWEYMVYNKLDQMVLSQDANQRSSNQWTVTKYDALGRVIITGLWNAGSMISQATLQTNIYAAAQWDERNTGTTGSGYTISSYPTTLNDTLAVNYYDYYDIPSKPSNYAAPGNAGVIATDQLTASKVFVLQSGGTVSTQALWKVMYYDAEGRNIKAYSQHNLAGNFSKYNYEEVSSSYSFNDELLTNTRKHYSKNSGNIAADLKLTIANTFDYDHMGRKVKSWQQVNGGTNVLLAKINFNEVGQLLTKQLHSTNSGGTFLQTVTYGYSERGWLRTSNSSGNLFNMELKYDTPTSGKQYNGNISQMDYYGGYSATTKNFVYSYDKLNRLMTAVSTNNALNETLAYDVMGNITSLTRTGIKAASLGYAYTGNQLQTVQNNSAGFRSYAYDANGNATSNGKSRMISYNLLNLPRSVDTAGVNKATYTYDATGQKLRNTGSDGTWDYIGGIVYHNNVIEFVQTEEGRAKPNGTDYTYEYNLKDHLGNTRVSFYSNNGTASIMQEDDYYAFGLRRNVYDASNNNRYLYNGKEIQTDLADQYDYGARFYDPVIARWTVLDALAEHPNQIDKSPYAYGWNNPTNLTDPDGNCPLCVWVLEAIAAATTTEVVGGAIFVGGGTLLTVSMLQRNNRNSGGYSAPRDATNVARPTFINAKQKDAGNDSKKPQGANNKKVKSAAETGQEAHRQKQKELKEQGADVEVSMELEDGTKVRKDAVMPDGTPVIIKPNTPTGRKSAQKREDLLDKNGHDGKKKPAPQTILYDPTDQAYQPGSPTYIGPKPKQQ